MWEKKEKRDHQNKLEEMLELHGIYYLSTPRPVKRGGGSAITVDNEIYSIKEVKDDNLEITIGIFNRVEYTQKSRNFIFAPHFYYVK